MRTIAICMILGIPALRDDADRVLFDFEKDEEAAAWSAFEDPKEPAARIEASTEHATSGARSLKITFAGGRWPSVKTSSVPDDWSAWKTLTAEVTVARNCLVGFQVVQEKSLRGNGWDADISRWARTFFLKPGRNDLRASLEDPSRNGYGLNPKKYGKVTSLEIFFYTPHAGESVHVDRIRLLREATPAVKPAVSFKVAGAGIEVSGVQELGKKLKEKWTKPEPRTVDQVEADFKAQVESLKAAHPKAVLATFREGENGYHGWQDAHINSHGPDTALEGRSKNTGSSGTQEMFMRHRSAIMRADLSSIPAGSTILAARLIVVAADEKFEKGRDPRVDPNMWVAEPCNRPWVEGEVNAYEYAKDKFWKAVGGMDYGDDPDFLPLYLAHGPGNAPVSTWDFTEAVRFWTDGTHPNHGFMLHGDSYHYMGRAHYRESADVRSRPAILVAYEPR